MRVYKKTVDIKGIGKFDKICTFSLPKGNFSEGIFRITIPIKKISDNIIQTDTVSAKNYKEVEENYSKAIQALYASHYEYERVIFYQIDQKGSYKDGTGAGFIFNFCIARKILNGNQYGKNIFFERSPWNKDPYDFNKKEWIEIKWTQAREDFLNQIAIGINNLYENLKKFTNIANMEDSELHDIMSNLFTQKQLN